MFYNESNDDNNLVMLVCFRTVKNLNNLTYDILPFTSSIPTMQCKGICRRLPIRRYQILRPVRFVETWLKLAEKHCSG